MAKPLIDVPTLHAELERAPATNKPLLLDCRFDLADPALGYHLFEQGHIPSARHADLNRDLSSTHLPGKTGRHPLPRTLDFAETLQHWGVMPSRLVVCYDDSGGCFAARAWWLLRWAGLEHVTVLDGGFSAWRNAQLPAQNGPPEKSTTLQPTRQAGYGGHGSTSFMPQFREELVISAEHIQKNLFAASNNSFALIDARAQDRFRGENETIDPIAGHIPTAICLPFADNLDEHGLFKSPEALRAQFEPYASPEATVYCGSGVTACHNILACAIADLPWPRLYAGSWSDWITNPERPMALLEN
jgi:thiosulfate/3-mercaptopyruvate sulfurtransferase